MRFEVTLRVTTPDGEMREREVIVLDKGHDRHEDTGLSIEEGKALLKTLQHQIVASPGRGVLCLEVCVSGLQDVSCAKRAAAPSATAPYLAISRLQARGITAVAARADVRRPSAP